MTANLHLPATAVASFTANRVRSGKVHRIRSGKPAATIGRNRRQYAVACGYRSPLAFKLDMALPVRTAPLSDLCRACWTDKQLTKAGVTLPPDSTSGGSGS